MRFQTLTGGVKPEKVWITVKSGEASADINAGEPVAWKNTGDGITVTRLGTAAAILATSGLAGIALQTISAGKVGLAQVYGLCTTAKVSLITKASDASTYDTVSGAAGLLLNPSTGNNALTTAASVAASAFAPWGYMPASTSFATGTQATGTANTAIVKTMSVFLRLM